MTQRSAPCKLDGGPCNPLPVEVRGTWDEGGFYVEEVCITIGGKEYDLYENLSADALDDLREQARDHFTEEWVRYGP